MPSPFSRRRIFSAVAIALFAAALLSRQAAPAHETTADENGPTSSEPAPSRQSDGLLRQRMRAYRGPSWHLTWKEQQSEPHPNRRLNESLVLAIFNVNDPFIAYTFLDKASEAQIEVLLSDDYTFETDHANRPRGISTHTPLEDLDLPVRDFALTQLATTALRLGRPDLLVRATLAIKDPLLKAIISGKAPDPILRSLAFQAMVAQNRSKLEPMYDKIPGYHVR